MNRKEEHTHEDGLAHGRDGSCGCASCRAAGRPLPETEEDELRENTKFRCEITFLAAAFVIFFAALTAEELHLFRGESARVSLQTIFAVLYIITGLPVLKSAARAMARGDIFNEFTLMSGATLAAFAIGESCETAGVMIFYRLGEVIQERAISKSRRAIKPLLSEKPAGAGGAADSPPDEFAAARERDTARKDAGQTLRRERFITRFARWYTPAVFLASAAVMLLPPLALRAPWHDSIYRGLVLLVISCPCALVISIPLGYSGGIGAALRQGILVKGAEVFDALCKAEIAVFDKTGTLTSGCFKISDISPAKGVTREELIRTAALAETGSPHTAARAITEAAGTAYAPLVATVTRISGKGAICRAGGDTIISGSAALLSEHGKTPPPAAPQGTVTYVMKNGRFIGSITADDEVRPDSVETVKTLRALGIKEIYMLTGDGEETASRVARGLSLDGWRSELTQGDKRSALHEICGGKIKKALYVCDGGCREAGDGPLIVLHKKSGSTEGFVPPDAAETASAVILDDSPAKIVTLLRIAKKTRAIVWENVALAFGVKGLLLALGASGGAGLWEAAFADVGVALMAILNATRAARLE